MCTGCAARRVVDTGLNPVTIAGDVNGCIRGNEGLIGAEGNAGEPGGTANEPPRTGDAGGICADEMELSTDEMGVAPCDLEDEPECAEGLYGADGVCATYITCGEDGPCVTATGDDAWNCCVVYECNDTCVGDGAGL